MPRPPGARHDQYISEMSTRKDIRGINPAGGAPGPPGIPKGGGGMPRPPMLSVSGLQLTPDLGSEGFVPGKPGNGGGGKPPGPPGC